jgi:hypothetical protein
MEASCVTSAILRQSAAALRTSSTFMAVTLISIGHSEIRQSAAIPDRFPLGTLTNGVVEERSEEVLMKVTSLRYFVVLSEEGQFSKAAARCGVAQPSLSAGIRRLEERFGCRLFERQPVSLTTAGKAALPHIRKALEEIDIAMHYVRSRRALSTT